MPIFRYNETAGNYYAYLIEGHGDDANDGLTPETAVATLDRLMEILDTYAGTDRRYAVIFKKRIYEATTYDSTRVNPMTFEFIGGCELDYTGSLRFRFLRNTDIVIGATFINTPAGFSPLGSNVPSTYIKNCVFENCARISYAAGNSLYFDNCVIKNSRTTDHAAIIDLLNCVLINCTTLNFRHNIKNTIFYNCTYGTITSLAIDFSNLYNSTINGLDNDGLKAVSLNINGISANPQFTDPINGQYTVKQASPCLYRGEGGEHIGIGEGFYLTANLIFLQQSVLNNFQLTSGLLGFIDPLDNAFIETNPIDIGQIITLESAELAAILPTVAGEFTAGPVHYSHWYPAYSAASTYHKGAGVTDSAILYRSLVDDNLNNTPASSATEWERLTWESGVSYAAGKIVQYTDDKWYKANTATSTSWVAGEWDEVVMTREWNLQVKTGRTYDECNAADWATIPYNTTPYLDTAGLGNSDDDYDPLTAAVMVFRFIAVRIDAKTIV